MDCEFIGWCALTASEQAAWVQAVGSVAAIAVPISLYMSDRMDRKRADKRARATFMVLLRPVLRRFEAKLRAFVLQSGDAEEGEVLDVTKLDGDYRSEVPALLDLLRQAPALPDLDDELTTLAHEIEDLQADEDLVQDLMVGGLHSAWINNRADIARKARLAQRRAERILQLVAPTVSEH